MRNILGDTAKLLERTAVALRPWLVMVFVIGSLYLGYRLWSDYALIADYIESLTVPQVIVAVLCAIACSLIRAAYRLTLYRLAGFDSERLPAVLALRSYGWGQLMRYIPGKIMGPAAEASILASRLGVGDLARITLFETFAMLQLSALWLAASALWLMGFGWLAAPAGVVAILIVFWLHKRRPYLSGGQATPRNQVKINKQAYACTVWLVMEWVMFYAVWIAFVDDGWFAAATSYAFASLAGTIVFVAPAGLGVREAVYALVAPLVAPEAGGRVLAQAVLARVLFTLADVVMPALFQIPKGVRHGA